MGPPPKFEFNVPKSDVSLSELLAMWERYAESVNDVESANKIIFAALHHLNVAQDAAYEAWESSMGDDL